MKIIRKQHMKRIIYISIFTILVLALTFDDGPTDK